MQSHLKKLISLVFLGSIAFNSYGMEGNSKGKEKVTEQSEDDRQSSRQSYSQTQLRPSDRQSRIIYNPIHKMRELRQLAEEKGWFINRTMSEDHAQRIFKTLPTDMQTLIEEFANEESRTTYPYRHAIILDGPPGTGKSTVSFAIAYHLNFAHIFVPATSLVDEWKNSGPENIASLFNLAKKENRPILITIDEINSLLDRHKSDHNPDHGILHAFLQGIDNLRESQVFVILTTNGLEDYPDNFISRFSNNTFTIQKPSEDGRNIIIESLMDSYGIRKKSRSNRHTDEQELTVAEGIKEESLLKKTEGLDYREIEDQFQEAFRIAQKRKQNTQFVPITEQDFSLARKKIIKQRPSKIVKQFKKASKFCKDHAAIITFGLTTGALIGGYYYFVKQRQLSLDQMTQQVTLTNVQMMVQAWKEEHIREASATWIRLVPILGPYYSAKIETIAAKEITEKLKEYAPDVYKSLPLISDTTIEVLSHEANTSLVAAGAGTAGGCLAAVIYAVYAGMKAGGAAGLVIDKTFVGQTLGLGAAVGSAVGGLIGGIYYFVKK